MIEATPLQLGAEDGHLTYPELAAAIDRAATALLGAAASRRG